MKKIKYLFTGICVLTLLSACLKDYQDLNTNPDKFGETDPLHAFTGATKGFNTSTRGHWTGKYSTAMVYMQYVVPNGRASENTYVSSGSANNHPQVNAPWYSDYYQTGQDNQGAFGMRLNYLINRIVPDAADPSIYNDLVAISEILLYYKQWMILDTYGAAPLTEAFKWNEENFTPRYDLYQESVDGEPMYKVIDAKLKKAVATLKASDDSQRNLGNNDFFYGGDVAKWAKAGNTIRVKLAQRLEKADKTFYNEVINDVLASASNVMGSNDDSFIYWHPSNFNGNNTDDIHNLTHNFVASAAFVNYLTEYNDPRLPLLVRRNGFGDGNNNEDNDKWFDTFIKEYPDYQVGRKVAEDSVVLNTQPFSVRYIGMSANPANNSNLLGSITLGHNLTAIPYTQIDEETGKPVLDEKTGQPIKANLSLRMYSQFESRYFVKQGGKLTAASIDTRNLEDNKYRVSDDAVHTFTPILTYPEACFMFAEIAFKKGGAVAGKDATTWYREGIKASMEQVAAWAARTYVLPQINKEAGVYAPLAAADVEAYLAQPEFQSATLEKIISQQWVNLFMQPEEMWATWKRTGLPAFKAAEVLEFDLLNKDGSAKGTTTGIVLGPKPEDGVAYFEEIKGANNTTLTIPRRNQLGSPNSANTENWEAAIEKLKSDPKYGTDVDQTQGRIWWDVE